MRLELGGGAALLRNIVPRQLRAAILPGRLLLQGHRGYGHLSLRRAFRGATTPTRRVAPAQPCRRHHPCRWRRTLGCVQTHLGCLDDGFCSHRGGSGRAESTPLIFTMPGDGPSLRCFRAAPARAGRNEGRAKTVRRVGLHHWAFCVLCALTGPAAMRSAPWNTLGASRGTAIGRERGTTQPQKLAAFAAVVSHPGRASAIVCVRARCALLEWCPRRAPGYL